MTMTDEPRTEEREWWDHPADEHGDFEYTLRQFLLMRRLHLGGEWTDVCNDVSREIAQNPDWDIEERDTYRNWRVWYYGGNR